jgi:hypothetical protein
MNEFLSANTAGAKAKKVDERKTSKHGDFNG